jgi:transposase InsO family protein
MSEAARQLVADQADEWLSVAAAARLTRQSVRHWRRRAEWEAKQARIQQRPALAEIRKGTERGSTGWYVHRSFDVGLTRILTAATVDERQRPALLTTHPQQKVETAYRKLHYLSEWRRRRQLERGTQASVAERIVAEAKRSEGPDFHIAFRTLKLWERVYRDQGVAGLIDRRGNEPAGGGAHEARSGEAIAYFYSLYHAGNQATIKTCHKATLRKAQANGWTWPRSYAATQKWHAKYGDKAAECIHRQGRKAYSQLYMPFIERDYTAVEPGELYVIDHTRCDFWAREGDVQFRPWLTSMIDARSRRIVGWNLGRTPHQDAILATMHAACRDCAVPERLYLDHGNDFLSELLTGRTKRETRRLRTLHGPDWQAIVAQQQTVYWNGVLDELGIERIEATPYAPWSKALIERWFGTFHDQCGKSFPTYCGHDAASKPDALEEVREATEDVPTLDDARTHVGEWIELYNRSSHSGQGMEGATPMDVWQHARRLRRADTKALAMLLQTRGVYRVGKNGVSFKVGGTTQSYGRCSAALRSYAGRDVLVKLDPADCSYCEAFTAERGKHRFIGRLDANQRIPANTPVDQLREAIRAVRGRRKIMGQAQREGAGRMRNAAQELRAMQAAERRELRATGTDDHRPNVAIVRTGFEGTSTPVRSPVEDRKGRDLARAAEALRFGRPSGPVDKPEAPRLTFADLARLRVASLTDAIDAEQGTDADSTPRDAFAALGRDRHERATT